MSADPSIVPVSAVIPCFRCSDTIERAVESVATQTQRPAELLLVDDASGDDTLPTLERIRDRFGEWIRVIPLATNGGPSVARNTGWEAARQPYVAFLDADDAWHPRKIEIQHAWMREHPEATLTGHSYVRVEAATSPACSPGRCVARRVHGWRLLLSNCFPTRTVMVRREVPFRFPPDKRHSEDYQLWLTMVLSGEPSYRLEAPLAMRYKAPYGEGGLSGDLWRMEAGELDTYWKLRRARLISIPAFAGLAAISYAKFLGRTAVVQSRRALRLGPVRSSGSAPAAGSP